MVSGPDVMRIVEQIDQEISNYREKILDTMYKLPTHFKNIIKGELHHGGRDVHAILYLDDKKRAVHIQAYPGFSDKEGMYVNARIMDVQKLEDIRKTTGVSPGNEHESAGPWIAPLGRGDKIEYNPEIISNIIYKSL
ncbi:MAG: hypothetical protein GOU98_00255 [Candidatus Altiarchaeota archaeon]|nr:hypothetical protein [Candidatus Altiarchaeota archaeon]